MNASKVDDNQNIQDKGPFLHVHITLTKMLYLLLNDSHIVMWFSSQMFDVSGLRLRYSTQLKFIPEAPDDSLPCFRLLNQNGQITDSSYVSEVSKSIQVFF